MNTCFSNVCDMEKKAKNLPHMRTIAKMATYLMQQIWRHKSRVPLPQSILFNNWASAWDFLLTCVDSGEPLQPPFKGTNILAIILVPLIMTHSRGHTGQIKGTAIMRWLWLPYWGNKVAPYRVKVFYDKILIFILVNEIVLHTGKSPLEPQLILWDTETVPYQLIL